MILYFKKSVKIIIVWAFVLACCLSHVNDAQASDAKEQLKISIDKMNDVQVPDAQGQLKISTDKILEILKCSYLQTDENKKKRTEYLSAIINDRFNFRKMSQLSLSRQWKKISEKEKETFTKIFGQLLEETYTSKIDAYISNDIQIVYIKENVREKRAKIYTKIINGKFEIPIDYRMYQTEDGKWMVYDLVIEGVSLVGNYRSQFDQILRKEPYEKLVEDLEKKLDN